jgi:hypothetical protein
VTPLRKTPAGWAAFRALRRTPTPMPERRHGNAKHGRYTAEAVARRRRARAFWRWILAGEPWKPPPRQG